MRLLLLALVLCGCSPKTPNQPERVPDYGPTYDQVADRALEMSEDGWVVSRYDSGEAHSRGDSLLFTGLAMGALDCTRGAVPEAALLKMLAVNYGLPYRHPTLSNDYSLDGLLGLWWGIDKRVHRCPESWDRWISPLKEHLRALTPPFNFGVVLNSVASRMGVADMPSPDARGELGATVAGWASAVVSSHAAAFRLHLGYLALSLVDAPKGRDAYCEVVKEAQIQLIEDFCSRGDLKGWLGDFTYDRWEYHFQRAAWETESVPDGLHTPAIDYLMAVRQL